MHSAQRLRDAGQFPPCSTPFIAQGPHRPGVQNPEGGVRPRDAQAGTHQRGWRSAHKDIRLFLMKVCCLIGFPVCLRVYKSNELHLQL